MARSKSWTESQQPENQYTYGQYWFNVIAMMLIAAVLIGFAIYWAWPTAKETTRVFLVRADAKAELRAIPFQENDFVELEGAFTQDEIFVLHEFNDKDSFDLTASLKEQSHEQTTAIIICSAIGAVDSESHPVLRSTTSSGPGIPVKQFLEEFVENAKCEQFIVVLDCGHDYSQPSAYLNEGNFIPGDDFNEFVSAVDRLVASGDVTDKPLAVITSTDVGEIPLYSYNQRRTLFGLALQNTLGQPHATVADLHQSLVQYCYEHGGEAAQTPRLFTSGQSKDLPEIASLKISRKDEDEDEEKKEDSELVTSVQDDKTEKELKQIANFWAERDQVVDDFKKAKLLLPEDFDTAKWENSIEQITESTAMLRSSKLQSLISIGDFSPARNRNAVNQIIAKFPGLLQSEEDGSLLDESNASNANAPSFSNNGLVDPTTKRDIAKAFLTQHRAKLRAKYYLAIFDSLSWLDNSESLNNFEQAVKELNSSLGNPLFSNPTVNASDVDTLRLAANEIAGKDELAIRRLKQLCGFLGGNSDNRHGCTREMAIVALLDSPLIESGSTNPEATPQIHERLGLMKALEKDVSGVGEQRITSDIRKTSSSRRHDLYASFQNFHLPLNDKEKDSLVNSRIHDSIAYYLTVGRSYLLDLNVTPLKRVFNISLKDRENLIKMKQVDMNATVIDLGLALNSGDLDGQKVNLVCELKSESPFEIIGGTKVGNTVHLKDSDGKIQIRATKNAAEAETGSKQVLKVRVENKYREISFTRNELEDSIDIPLALPGENRVELSIAMSGKPIRGSVLRPWPNRNESVEFSIRNFFHKERTLQATLYACKSIPEHSIMPGNIDEKVKAESIRDLGSLLAVAQSSPIKLGKGVPGTPSEPEVISWSPAEPNPNLKLLGSDKPVVQGLLCRVVDITAETPSVVEDIWISIFPDTRDFAEKTLVLKRDKVKLGFAKKDFFKGKPAKLRFWLGNKDVSGPISIEPQIDSAEDRVVVDEWESTIQKFKSNVPLLHIDVDGWPRRHTYVFENGQFQDVSSDSRYRSIEFIVPPSKPDAPGIKFKKIGTNDSNVKFAYGYKQKTGSPFVDGVLKVNCDIVNQFRFPSSKDYFEVKYANDRPERYFFPRNIESFMAVDPANPKRFSLRTAVSDFTQRKELEIESYKVDPTAFVIDGGKPEKLDGRDVTQIIFDDVGPSRPEVEIVTLSKKIVPGKQVVFSVGNVKDVGVGVISGITTSKISAAILQPSAPKEKPIGFQKLVGSNNLVFVAPEQLGSYELKIYISDRIGNKSQAGTARFNVYAKPKVVKKKAPEKKKIVATPKPVTHVLKVVVQVASSPLEAGQEPDLKIEPAEGVSVNRKSGDTFEFTGLKAGQEYVVSGTFKLTTGFGVETKGKTSPWKIPQESPRKRTATKALRLQ